MKHEQNWNPSDSEKNYKELNGDKPNYTKDEITYSFNDDGYRCDSFSDKTDLSVLFMGCSITEGIGLPLNETWSYHLHNRLVSTTNKNIPFWSLGKGGTSIDYAARSFYDHGPKLKPKYAFYLMSGIGRREFSYESSDIQNWFPNASPLFSRSEGFKTVTKVFADANFALYQALRSAMILNLVATLTNTKIFIFGLNMDGIMKEELKINLFKKFDNIEYFPVDYKNINPSLSIPKSIADRPIKARDNLHPGAAWQYTMYDRIWKIVENKISKD